MKTTPVHQSLETPTETDTQEHVYQKSVRDVSELYEAASDWNVVSNQQSFIDQAIDQWKDYSNACLKAKSIHWTFAIMFLRNCYDFKNVRYCWYEQIDLCFVSQGRVRTSVRIGGQFCCGFVANLLQYLCASNYRNIMWFDKVVAKIKRVQILPHSVVL